MFLFAGDQKIEHLLRCDPEHLFKIASNAPITAFATQLGLIERYGADYNSIPYVVKLNSKTNLVQHEDPLSLALHSVEDVCELQGRLKLQVVGVGYTVYLGSVHEAQMLREAAQVVYKAHKNDLLAVLWMYPRGKAVEDDRHVDLIAGAASVGACLGADFVKVNAPRGDAALLKDVVKAAGRTQVICAGGAKVADEEFLQRLHDQIHVGGCAGFAIGRNIHERSQEDAVAFCERIKAVMSGG